MARAPLIQVEGAREVRTAMRRMDDRLDGMKDVHQDAAEPVASEARELVPVRSGALRASIRTDRRANGANVLAGKRPVPYAGPIHFGWRGRNIEPQPFLYDAADRRAGEVRERYQRGVDDLIARYDRETPDRIL